MIDNFLFIISSSLIYDKELNKGTCFRHPSQPQIPSFTTGKPLKQKFTNLCFTCKSLNISILTVKHECYRR